MVETPKTPESSTARRNKRTLVGVVTSDKMAKTITVEVTRLVKHATYGKYVRRRARFKAHDERSEAKMGDTVMVVECAPLSRTKRWRLQKVLSKAVER
ncbi:MAG: 30S ribosomal protein S17 [Deltaproteobacteria bacterium]|nr:30S ribosomal protein S17 [Deltaproteobacteria bacterium]